MVDQKVDNIDGLVATEVNKAVCTAALVADWWAGAENLEKQLCDGRTDGRTDRRTDQKVAYRVACSRLKKKKN